MKKPDLALKEYCQRISDDQLKFLAQRLNQRLSGDVAEVVECLSGVKEIDRLFAAAATCDELFDVIDQIYSTAQKEYERRNNIGSKPAA